MIVIFETVIQFQNISLRKDLQRMTLPLSMSMTCMYLVQHNTNPMSLQPVLIYDFSLILYFCVISLLIFMLNGRIECCSLHRKWLVSGRRKWLVPLQLLSITSTPWWRLAAQGKLLFALELGLLLSYWQWAHGLTICLSIMLNFILLD